MKDNLYDLTPDVRCPKPELPPEPFYDQTTIYHDSDGDWQAVPDWIAVTVIGAGLAFLGVVCWVCWMVIHHAKGTL